MKSMMIFLFIFGFAQPIIARNTAKKQLLMQFGLGQPVAVFLGTENIGNCSEFKIKHQPQNKMLWFLDQSWALENFTHKLAFFGIEKNGLVLKEHRNTESLSEEVFYGVAFLQSAYQASSDNEFCEASSYVNQVGLGYKSLIKFQLNYSSPLMKKIARKVLGIISKGSIEEFFEGIFLVKEMFPKNFDWDISINLSRDFYESDSLGRLIESQFECNFKKERNSCLDFFTLFRETHGNIAFLNNIEVLKKKDNRGLPLYGTTNLNQSQIQNLIDLIKIHDGFLYELNALIYSLPPELLAYKSNLEVIRDKVALISVQIPRVETGEIQFIANEISEQQEIFRKIKGLSITFHYCQGMELTDPMGIDHFYEEFSLFGCLDFVEYVLKNSRFLDAEFFQREATWNHQILLTNASEVSNVDLYERPFKDFENYLKLPNLKSLTLDTFSALKENSFYHKILED